MDMSAPTNVVEIAKAIGALATPIAVAGFAYVLQRRQRTLEAAMAERVKHISVLSPLINRIYCYRQRVGAFLDCSPEQTLDAKREADREFWTFEYLWSTRFRNSYHVFMYESFDMYAGEGQKAAIKAQSSYYPKKATTPGWTAFDETPVNKQQNKAAYDKLQEAIAIDLGFQAWSRRT
jgi:hypothetical protein